MEIRQLKTTIQDGIEIMALIGQDYKQTEEYKILNEKLKILEETNYFRIKEFDFNDVFDYDTYVKGTYDQVKKWLIDHYKPEYQTELDIDESSTDIYVMDWYPVTDENGNEISTDDPRYQDLADSEEARLSTSFSAELLDLNDVDQEILDKVINLGDDQ